MSSREPFDIDLEMMLQNPHGPEDEEPEPGERCEGSSSVVESDDGFATCAVCGWEWGHCHTDSPTALLPVHRPYPK
ncbi:MAG: hypothetical protein U1A78_41585 [Polyangia bacterium]